MKKAKCQTKYCRGKLDRGNYCGKCVMRKNRAMNPVLYAYIDKRAHAKLKGLEFTVSFEEYKLYWVKGGTIDRKENDKGYIPGNIQQLSREANAWKGTMPYKQWQKVQDDCPF